MTQPNYTTTQFLRGLVLDHMENFLDSGVDPTNVRDNEALKAAMADCLVALHFLERTTDLTYAEWDTVRTLTEFHEGAYTSQDDAPFNVRTFESLLGKLRG